MARLARHISLAGALLCFLVAASVRAEDAEEVAPIKGAVEATWTPAKCDIERVLKDSRKRYDGIKSYFSRMVRRHRMEGGDLMEPQFSDLWYKKPLAVRMTVTDGPRAGTDILYVQGKNDNRIRARGVGLLKLKAMNLKPDSGLAMKGELHPFTEVGIETTLALVEDQYALLKKRVPGLKVSCWTATLGERALRKYELVMPTDEKDENGEDVYFCDRAEVVFDLELKLPTEARVYEDGRLREEYVYYDIEIEPAFAANVFDFDDI